LYLGSSVIGLITWVGGTNLAKTFGLNQFGFCAFYHVLLIHLVFHKHDFWNIKLACLGSLTGLRLSHCLHLRKSLYASRIPGTVQASFAQSTILFMVLLSTKSMQVGAHNITSGSLLILSISI